MLDRVRREGQAYRAEQRATMYQRIEQAAMRRRWREAVEAARAFLDAHGDSPEAEPVRLQMPTLEDNARLEAVRELRDRIRDLINRRRFAEAASLARELIERYPDTAAAEDLRGQLPRLDELAAEEGQA
jgi:outer membrane protein assembly factor BamD (BamD/ComL family)